MNLIRLSIICLLALVSCQSGGPEGPNKELHDEIMVVHDEVMPEMSTIHRIKKRLRKFDDDGNLEVKTMIQRLDDADEAMMSWMADYKRPKGADSLSMIYLHNEKDKISEVSRLMKSAIKDGNELAGRLEAQGDK